MEELLQKLENLIGTDAEIIETLLAALESAAANESADKAVRASAQSFLEG